MGARTEDPRACLAHRVAQLAKFADSLGGRPVDIADQLDLTCVQLALDLPVLVAQALEDRCRAVRLASRRRVDQEELSSTPSENGSPDPKRWSRSASEVTPGHDPGSVG